MATISELQRRISALEQQNSELNEESKEYESMLSDLSTLINAHISCINRDKSALSVARLLPSRCITAVIGELNAQLHSGAVSSLQGAASSVSGKAMNMKMNIAEKISNNNTAINNCRYTISRLSKEESGSTTMKA